VSTLPLSGSFAINCKLPDNTLKTTLEIPANSTTSFIKDKITAACPQYKDRIEVTDGPAYPANIYDDGRDIIIKFSSVNKDID
jgi:hypothetical protein